MSQRKANISIPFPTFIKCSLTRNTYQSGRIGIHAKRNLWKLTLSKKTWQIKLTKNIGNQCQKNFFCDMYDVVYLSDTNKDTTQFKNTDKAIFSIQYIAKYNLTNETIIIHIYYWLYIPSVWSKPNFFSGRIQLCKGNVFTLFFAATAQKRRSILDFVSLLDMQRIFFLSRCILKQRIAAQGEYNFVRTYCIGYVVAAITQSKKDSQ